MKGIYIIENISNNKIYIGSSINIEKRLRDHKRNLSQKKHCNKDLQRDYNHYGNKMFEFRILEEISVFSEAVLKHREQYWVDYYDAFSKGYNSVGILKADSYSMSDGVRNLLHSKILYDRNKEAEWERQYAIQKAKYETLYETRRGSTVSNFINKITCALFVSAKQRTEEANKNLLHEERKLKELFNKSPKQEAIYLRWRKVSELIAQEIGGPSAARVIIMLRNNGWKFN